VIIAIHSYLAQEVALFANEITIQVEMMLGRKYPKGSPFGEEHPVSKMLAKQENATRSRSPWWHFYV